jgi:hypothetical protein
MPPPLPLYHGHLAKGRPKLLPVPRLHLPPKPGRREFALIEILVNKPENKKYCTVKSNIYIRETNSMIQMITTKFKKNSTLTVRPVSPNGYDDL